VSTTITRTKTVRDGKMWRMSQALKRDLPGVGAVAAVTVLGLWLGGRADLTNVPIAFSLRESLSCQCGSATRRPSSQQSPVRSVLTTSSCLPMGVFQITRSRDLLTDIAMLAVAVLVSTLNERLRREARSARLSERQTESLYSLVRELADAHSLDSLNIAGMRQIESAVAEVSARVLIRDGAEGFKCAFSSGGRVAWRPKTSRSRTGPPLTWNRPVKGRGTCPWLLPATSHWSPRAGVSAFWRFARARATRRWWSGRPR